MQRDVIVSSFKTDVWRSDSRHECLRLVAKVGLTRTVRRVHRDRPLTQLTNLYNDRPQWLADAHQPLDVAVAQAYGWNADITDEEALARLLALNLAQSPSGPSA